MASKIWYNTGTQTHQGVYSVGENPIHHPADDNFCAEEVTTCDGCGNKLDPAKFAEYPIDRSYDQNCRSMIFCSACCQRQTEERSWEGEN